MTYLEAISAQNVIFLLEHFWRQSVRHRFPAAGDPF